METILKSMFEERRPTWHNLGTNVEEALTSKEALGRASLDWSVTQKPIMTTVGQMVKGYKANIRTSDESILGLVTDRYRVVQNHEAFAFIDELVNYGVKYDTVGSVQGGKKVWILVRLPNNYVINGDKICPYMVFSNSHDGSGAIKIAITPIRVICQNTLNLALSQSRRMWSIVHKGDIQVKLCEALETLKSAYSYMDKLGEEINSLTKIKLNKDKVTTFIDKLIPLDNNASAIQEKNVITLRNDMRSRYFNAPDLEQFDDNGYKFINAVSDFATHAKPLRETRTFRENLFMKTIDGNPLIDNAYGMLKEVV